VKSKISKTEQKGKTSVLYVVPQLVVGGAERQLCELLRKLDKDRFRPVVCCIKERGFFFEELQRCGVEAICLNAGSRRNLMGHLSAILRLTALMHREEVEIVQTWGFNAGVLGKVAGKIARVPGVVGIEHRTGEWRSSILRRLVNRLLLLLTDKTICVAERQKKFLVENRGYDASKVEVIYNGVDLSRYASAKDQSALRAGLLIPEDGFVVGILAALRPEKAHSVFLEAAKEILDTLPNTYFLIVGDGSEREKLERLCDNLGISGRVVFAGFRPDTADVLQLFDVSVLSSLPVIETFPMTILESMAAAKPVVVTDVGGLSEMVINGETGIIVPPDDPKSLATATTRILQDPMLARRMGQAGRKRVEANFTIEKMTEKYQTLYQGLVAAKT
jgi:glycosyltransferase involved in cell wall biosynthesis